jgi:hypothetical protein
MVKPEWDRSVMPKGYECFYSGLHKNLECRDTKLLACLFLGASQISQPSRGQSQQTLTTLPSREKTEEMEFLDPSKNHKPRPEIFWKKET